MPCVSYGNAIVCGPGRTYRRFYGHCPVCDCRRRFVARFDGLYYGETHMCCGCGDRWQDGEMCPRPFQRGWRDKAKETARTWWQEAMTPRQYNAFMRAEMDEMFGDAA